MRRDFEAAGQMTQDKYVISFLLNIRLKYVISYYKNVWQTVSK